VLLIDTYSLTQLLQIKIVSRSKPQTLNLRIYIIRRRALFTEY